MDLWTVDLPNPERNKFQAAGLIPSDLEPCKNIGRTYNCLPSSPTYGEPGTRRRKDKLVEHEAKSHCIIKAKLLCHK
jgi:hypothetical protein